MAQTLLQAINVLLRAVQASAAQTANDANRHVAMAKATLNEERVRVLNYGYRFSVDTIDLSYDATAGKVAVSPDYLGIRLPKPYTVRDDGVWDGPNNRFHNEAIENVEVVVDVALEDMPSEIQNWVIRSAAAEFYESINDETSPKLEKKKKAAWAQAMASEHKTIDNPTGITRLNVAFSKAV